MADTFLIVDGNSLVHRAFHALPLLSFGGNYTNAVQGFFMMLFRVFQEDKPAYCAVCFDEHEPTFRHTVYEAYKAGRKPTPDELKTQFPIVKELLAAMGIGVISLVGYEADDLLGTLSRQANEKGVRALLLTGDRDALQLVDDSTHVLFTKKGISETVRFTPEEVLNVYEITPAQVTDWKGLAGDASDNIPGVPGVGDKTAVKLLKTYQTLENVLDSADSIPGKLGENIRSNKEKALFSKDLATIRRTAPIACDLNTFTLSRLNEGLPAMQKYGLSALSKRLTSLGQKAEAQLAPPATGETMPETRFSAPEELRTGAEINALAQTLLGTPVALHFGATLSLATAEGKQYFVSTAYDLMTPGIAPEEALLALAPLLSKGQLIVHDFKALLNRADGLSLTLGKPFFDTMIAQYLLNPQEKSYALHHFQEDSACGVFHLYQAQAQRLKADGMETLYRTVELPLVSVLFQMEREGFSVDANMLSHLGQVFSSKIEALKERIYESTGNRDFNINSPQQLGKVLFEDLNLPHGKKGKTGYSTSADILEGLSGSHPAIDDILSYRQLSKLNSTYIEGLLRLKDATGRVHTTFDQTATATGRISSNEPNLQNIPVRQDVGREIRRAFVPRDEWVLVDADYSQIELRILAHLSGDEAMVEAFMLSQDVHTRTAAEVFDVPMDEVTPQMRSSSKAVNFGLVYGISEFGLAKNIGVSRGEAAAFIKKYFVRYPGIKRFMDEAVQKGIEKGYAETMLGRRRYLPELTSDRNNIREFGKRIAMNMPVQGTAADIIKLAMVRVSDRLTDANLQARLILQVHDELLIECPREEAETVSALLKREMENVVKLSVPLIAEVNVGASWYETK